MKKVLFSAIFIAAFISTSAQKIIIYKGGNIEKTFSGGDYRVVFESEPDYVDLGLPSKLKWATCNIDATTPENFGDYFAWGEVDTYYQTKTKGENGASATAPKKKLRMPTANY